MSWNLPPLALQSTSPAGNFAAAKSSRGPEEEKVTRESGRQRRLDGRHKAIYTLTAWSHEQLDMGPRYNDAPRLEGLLAHVRAASWGQVFPLCETQERLNRSIEVGMSFRVQPETYDQTRPTILVGVWHLSPTSCVAVSMLMPIPVTTMNDVGEIPSFALDMADRCVYVQESSSTRTDGSRYVRSYGTLRLTGRLAISVIGVAQRICHATGAPCVVKPPVSVHIGSSRIMYTVKSGASMQLCTLTMSSLEMLAYLCRNRPDTMFDELIVLTIYASLPDCAGTRNTPAHRAYLNACIRINSEGSIRYLGKPEGIRPAFEKLHAVLALPMQTPSIALDFVGTLHCVSASGF